MPWKGKVRGNDNHFKHGGKREGEEEERGGGKEGRGITASRLWSSAGFVLFRQMLQAMNTYCYWVATNHPRAGLSDNNFL